MEVAVLGMSVSPTCGVRAYATVLAEALDGEGVSCSLYWLQRGETSMRAAQSEVRAWARELAGELQLGSVDAALQHYSVFAYSHRGLPLFVRPALAALRSARIPLITVLHEIAYPWRLGGWRGSTWALTQRAVFIDVMRLSRAAVVTADFRAQWLTSRRWLPRRPVVAAPVFSNLPPPSPRSSLLHPRPSPFVIGPSLLHPRPSTIVIGT
jgi:hypothetical protein